MIFYEMQASTNKVNTFKTPVYCAPKWSACLKYF